MEAAAENKNRYMALILTLGFHGLLILLFILIVFITPLPPFEIKPPPEVLLDLGMEGLGNADAGGSGENDPDLATNPDAVPTPASNNTPNIITDESEKDVPVKSNPDNKNDAKADAVEDPKASSELLNALAALKKKPKKDGKGEGGQNSGGSGTGDNNGVGPGSSTGHGNDTPGTNGKGGYDLKGRLLLKKPDRMTDSQEEGIVVVEIIVDANGKVTKATPGQRGSTTTSANLYAKARQAAYQAKFNSSPEGVSEQRGTYTFVFTLE